MATTTFGSAMTPDMSGLRDMIRQRYAGRPPAPSAAPYATASVPTAAGASSTSGGITAPQTPPPPASSVAPPSSYASGSNYGSGTLGSISGILQSGQGAGYFDPGPNQGILDIVRQMALGDASAQRAHSALMAESLGTDPATAASYGLQSDLASQGGVSKAVNSATYGELTHQRDYIQNLLMGLLNKQGPQNAYNPQKFDWTDIASKLIPSASVPLGGGATLGL